MKINKFLLCSVAFVMFTSAVIMGGCKNKDKEIVLSENVAKDIQVEENEIEKYIKEGNKFLEEKKYTEARKSYEAAITKGKNDKQIYTDIKDEYIKKKRYDDAYYIIKLAIDNKVDTENMEKILTSIRVKMEGVELSYDIYEDDLSFVLPEEVEVIVDNNKIKDYVLWEKSKIDILNQPGRNQLYRDEDILRDEILVELLFLNTNLENYDNINIYVPCCDNIANISKSIEIIKLQNNVCNINFYGKLNFKNSLFDTTRVIFYSFEYDNIFLSSSKEIGFPFEYCSLENMDFIISDYIPKDIYDDGNFIHEFQNKLNYSSKLVMIIDKEQYSNNYINFIVLNDNLESIITFDNFFILVLNSNKSDDKKNKFLLSDYTLLDRNYINNLKQYKKKSLEKIGIYRDKMYNQYTELRR